AAGEIGCECDGLVLRQRLHQLEGVVTAVVVVDTRLDRVDAGDNWVDLDRVHAAARRARPLEAEDVAEDGRRAVAAPHLVEEDRELVDGHALSAIEPACRLPAAEGAV